MIIEKCSKGQLKIKVRNSCKTLNTLLKKNIKMIEKKMDILIVEFLMIIKQIIQLIILIMKMVFQIQKMKDLLQIWLKNPIIVLIFNKIIN